MSECEQCVALRRAAVAATDSGVPREQARVRSALEMCLMWIAADETTVERSEIMDVARRALDGGEK